MHTICLKDNWTLTVLGKNVYDIPETPIETKVPSTVYGTLLEKGLIPDPFYRDNELDALKLMENDFAYETEIVIGEEDRKRTALFYISTELIRSRMFIERRENRLRRQHEPCLGVRYYRSCCR